MEQIKIKVYAKVNLALDIKGVYDDGYHILDMLVTSVDVFDVITASKTNKSEVYMDGVLQDSSNTANKAVELLELAYGYPMKIEIQKGIPMKAGLGGSSADAAGAFYCYGQLFGIDLNYMHQIAMSVGSDVVYMMTGGAATVKCKGEMVFPHEDIDLNLVIAQSRVGADTGAVYHQYDKMSSNNQLNSIKIGDSTKCFNVLEPAAINLTPDIEHAKNELLKYTDKVFMTGSGSAFVGVFETLDKAKDCVQKLGEDFVYKTAVQTKSTGIKVLNEQNN